MITSGEVDRSASVLKLHALGADQLHYTLGHRGDVYQARDVDLTAVVEEASIRGSAILECPKVGGAPATDARKRPFLKIWFVGQPLAVKAEQVDDSVVERLRSLGYMW